MGYFPHNFLNFHYTCRVNYGDIYRYMIKVTFKKCKIDYAKAAAKKGAKDNVKSLSVVIPSPFFVDRGDYSKDIVNTIGSRVKVTSNHRKKGDGEFSYSHNMVYRFMRRINSHPAVKLLGYIGETIGFNTNKIIINPNNEEIKELIKDRHEFYKAIDYLEKYVYLNDKGECVYKGIICKTTKPHVYVVNHEIIFKGNYDSFVDTYMNNYNDVGILIDDRGRVVLDKSIKYE